MPMSFHASIPPTIAWSISESIEWIKLSYGKCPKVLNTLFHFFFFFWPKFCFLCSCSLKYFNSGMANTRDPYQTLQEQSDLQEQSALFAHAIFFQNLVHLFITFNLYLTCTHNTQGKWGFLEAKSTSCLHFNRIFFLTWFFQWKL